MAVTGWNLILEGEELAYLTTESARDARLAPLPDDLHPAVRDAIGVRRALRPPARGLGRGRPGRERDRHDRDGVGQDARVQPARARRARPGAEASRALPLSDEGARPGSGAGALDVQAAEARAAIYDGDTPSEQRWQVREWANLILSNPDMLHIGVLPHHDRWGDVLSNLRYVIVDEAHVYRGVFGSHVANVLRRLRRLARIYGAEPQFLFASATISNPGELTQRLLGAPATVIGDDATPRASERSRSGTRRSPTRGSACARRRSARRRGSWPRSSSRSSGRSSSRRAARRPS